MTLLPMDLSEIPFDVPVILQSVAHGKNLQNPLGSNKARCLGDARDIYEQLILRHVRDDKVAIQSARNGRFLKAQASGSCVFDSKEPGEWELFTMETDWVCSLFFVSCHTGNVLQCSDGDVARCANLNRLGWESWRILEPHATAATTSQAQPALPASSDGRVLAGKQRQDFILELAKYGKTADEIEQIVTHLFDAPPTSSVSDPSSAFAVLVNKE